MLVTTKTALMKITNRLTMRVSGGPNEYANWR